MNDLPGKIMVWHGPHPLPHAGSWATTRYPQEAEEYVKVAALPGMVQPLVWHGEEQFQRSGFYRITHYAGMQQPFKLEISGVVEYHETLEAAKAAAQKHHTSAILSALGVTDAP